MKKIRFISMVMLLAFVLMGAAFAGWSEDILINGSVATGNLDVTFSSATTDDEATTVDPGKDRNVGVTEATIGEGSKSISVTGTNAYPGYAATLTYKVANTGSIPVKITNAEITNVDGEITVVAADPANTVIDPGQEYTGTVTATVTDLAAELDNFSYTVTVKTAQWQ